MVSLVPIGIGHLGSGVWFCNVSFIAYVRRYKGVGPGRHRSRDRSGPRDIKMVLDCLIDKDQELFVWCAPLEFLQVLEFLGVRGVCFLACL